MRERPGGLRLTPAYCKDKLADGRARLTFQHNIAVSVSNGLLLHPSIPESRIKNIADVGTGTGIWLEDLRKRSRPNGLGDRCFDGFDISPARFPRSSNCTYHVHDVLQPFPAKYHGLYDLVHVRYMALSLRSGQYMSAANSLMDLLRPGGYIQWEELDYRDITANSESPTHDELLSLVTQLCLGRDLSVNCSHDVQKALKATGFENVTKEDRNSYWDNSLTPEARRWAWKTWGRSTARALLWSGLARDKDAAGILANGMLQKLDEEYSAGAVPNFAHRIMLGRKSICDI